jgi:hypothetical protein
VYNPLMPTKPLFAEIYLPMLEKTGDTTPEYLYQHHLQHFEIQGGVIVAPEAACLSGHASALISARFNANMLPMGDYRSSDGLFCFSSKFSGTVEYSLSRGADPSLQ